MYGACKSNEKLIQTFDREIPGEEKLERIG
jgi:hypothetical protein